MVLKEGKDTYRTYEDLFFLLINEAMEFNVAGDATSSGFARHLSQYLVDNGYEITKYECEEPTRDARRMAQNIDWRWKWMDNELDNLSMSQNALDDPKKFVGEGENE